MRLCVELGIRKRRTPFFEIVFSQFEGVQYRAWDGAHFSQRAAKPRLRYGWRYIHVGEASPVSILRHTSGTAIADCAAVAPCRTWRCELESRFHEKVGHGEKKE